MLRGLQWIFQTPASNAQVFWLLEQRVSVTKKATGQPGMDLWHVLVPGVVRVALDCDDDRLEYMVHHDTLLRRIMSLESHFSGECRQGLHDKTLREPVCHVDEALLAEITGIVVQAGRSVLKKKTTHPFAPNMTRTCSRTNVHFPTDVKLLWNACRNCLDLFLRLAHAHALPI